MTLSFGAAEDDRGEDCVCHLLYVLLAYSHIEVRIAEDGS